MVKIAVIGGGFAGLAALATLRERLPGEEIFLLDPRAQHIVRTRLHERIRRWNVHCRVDFATIARRFRCRYLRAALPLTEEFLLEADRRGELAWEQGRIQFDYLVIASGSREPILPAGESILTPDDLAERCWEEEIRVRLSRCGEKPWITVIGSGASGVQILFELDAWRRRWRERCGREIGLRLVSADSEVLAACPPLMRRYVLTKIENAKIAFYPNSLVQRCEPGRIVLQAKANGRELTLPSILNWACVGLRPWPRSLQTDGYGRVRLPGHTLTRVFAAGDCARFEGAGSNALSAQVAIRKGRHVAKNIYRQFKGWAMLPYLYQEQGYFISLGPADGVGWLRNRANVLTGLPAFLIREALETWYDLSIL